MWAVGARYDGKTHEQYAVYINQATAAVYCIVSSVLTIGRWVALKLSYAGDGTTAGDGKPRPRAMMLIAIGIMNGDVYQDMTTI